ncbi:MAG: endonuclease Q family protein [Candidatus Levyibacteriota bacterium]
MQYVTDLHLHSKYSRAVSPQMTLPVMTEYARQKGLDILSAADFTHPVWFKEIQSQLEESEEGLYTLRMENEEWGMMKKIRFLLSTEIASIYKQGDSVRRIHNLVFVPSLEIAEKTNKELVRRGANLNADGRPIVGLSCENLLELVLSIDERSYIIPAHVWTPHFGVYGSASGFDSLEEAFGKLAPYVYGIETGLSSDPGMNWQMPELMNRSILSFSDAHSAPKMSREATVMELEVPSYENIRKAIMRSSKPELGEANKIIYTLEFYPEEGKYHFSGHRDHKVVLGPDEIRENGNICPVCHRRLTEGVLFRVQQLADEKLLHRTQTNINDAGVKWYTDSLKIQPPYIKLVPLLEIAAESLGSTVNSQKSKNLYAKLCSELKSELHVLLRAPIAYIEKVGGGKLAQAVTKVRKGNISIDPGYDGIFGKVQIWHEGEEKAEDVPQLKLEL